MKVNSKLFGLIISILLLTDIAIILNIPFLRQVLGFLFLTILPGLVILQNMKLDRIDLLEKFILSWGLSISFLMIFGIWINYLYLTLGYLTPLSTISLLISLNSVIIVLAIIGYRVNKNFSFSISDIKLSASEKAFLIVPILFPALNIFGMHVMNTTDNNFILMVLLFLIPIYVAFVCFFNQKFPKRIYPVVIFLISISLILMLALRSNHIIGSDTHTEYLFFRTTLDNLRWSIFEAPNLDSCLSVSLLPTIYQSTLNLHPEFLFKILFALIFAVAPLIVYLISKKYIGDFYAFLASFFFMSGHSFLWTEASSRINIAILFFALAMMVLFNDNIDALKKRILFIMFMASCVVSHYATAYIFFFIILGSFLAMQALSRKYTFKKVLSFTIVLVFFSFIFIWYSYVTTTAFGAGVRFIHHSLNSLNSFFNIGSRPECAQEVLGKGVVPRGIPYTIQFIFTWLCFIFIGIGVVTMIRKYKEMSFPELYFKKTKFLKEKFEVAYFVITLACTGLLIATIVIPFIPAYGLSRVFIVITVILSVFFVIGGIMLSKHFFFFVKPFLSKERTCAKKDCNSFGKTFLSKKRFVLKEKQKSLTKNGSEVRAYLIILLVLIPYFLCNTGAMYNIMGIPHSVILNSEGDHYDAYYIHDLQLFAGEWLSGSKIVDGRVVNKQKTIGNMTEYGDMFDENDRIYDNGGSEIWK